MAAASLIDLVRPRAHDLVRDAVDPLTPRGRDRAQ